MTYKIMSVIEYRKLTNDKITSGELILKRIQYLDSICRNTINKELENQKNNKKACKKEPPKVTYKFVESKDGEHRLKQAYRILFEAVMASQDWSDKSDKKTNDFS